MEKADSGAVGIVDGDIRTQNDIGEIGGSDKVGDRTVVKGGFLIPIGRSDGFLELVGVGTAATEHDFGG